MSATPEAGWRHRTRTPVLLATAAAWVGAVEVSAVDGPDMTSMGPHLTVVAHPRMVTVGLMVASMMTPLLIEPLRHGLARSLRRRRRRAVVLLVAVHLTVWVIAGMALAAVASLLVDHAGRATALTTGLVVALVWNTTPTNRRLANQHHARPALAAFGLAADKDLAAYGARHAASCLGTCWAVMLLPTLCGVDALGVMAAGSAWIWALAFEVPERPRWEFLLPRRASRLVTGNARILLRRSRYGRATLAVGTGRMPRSRGW